MLFDTGNQPNSNYNYCLVANNASAFLNRLIIRLINLRARSLVLSIAAIAVSADILNSIRLTGMLNYCINNLILGARFTLL
jgi:hypothetical protein